MSDFKQDEEITPCLMRVVDGEMTAIFPTLPGYVGRDYSCTVYAHLGQHGCGDLHVMLNRRLSRPATPDEYASLKAELEGPPYGYRLKIFQRRQRSWDADRRAAYHS